MKGLDVGPQPLNIFFRCVEDSGEAIMISDRAGKLIYVNPAWCRIYGYSKEEAVGSTPRLLHSGLQSDEFYRKMWRDIMEPSIAYWKGELINRAKDGTLVPVLLTITPFRPFRDADSEIAGFIGIAVDISQKRELEAKVAHQDRLASIGLLASGLAHEVGTPLGVIRGRAEFLGMQADRPEVKKNLEVITSQIDRISKLIRSLLRVSRNVSDVNMTKVRIHAVAEEVIALVGRNLTQDSVNVQIEVPEDMTVRADSGRLEQILLNLVMNSTHAIRNAIHAGRGTGHSLIIGACESEGVTEIFVRDTGSGIAPEHMRRLFQPFFTTKEVGEGTGLGLAIVAQLVSEMGGEIFARSVVGEGATFTLRLKTC